MKTYLKIITGIIAVVVPCVLAVLIYNDKITQNSPVYYRQGVEFYNKGDYSNAYYNFGKIKKISPLYNMAVYKQAKSAQKKGDYSMAALKYELYIQRSPESVFAKSAKVNLAKSYYYMKRYEEAGKIFEQLYQSDNGKNPENLYYLGLIKKNSDKLKSKEYFLKYIDSELMKKEVNTARLASAAEELSLLNTQLSETDKKRIGMAYYTAQKYEKALEYFSNLPLSDCWDYLVLSNHYAGNKVVAKKLIETGIRSYSPITEDNNLHKIYDIYTSYMPDKKLGNRLRMYNLAKRYSLKCRDYTIYKLAQVSPKEKALRLYQEIAEEFPDGDYAAEALWNIIWSKYAQKDYKGAAELALSHLDKYKNVKSTPKVMFWLAKSCKHLDKMQEYNTYLAELMSKYPDNYYGLRAKYLAENDGGFWTTDKTAVIPVEKEETEFPISLSDMQIKDLKLVNTLFVMGDYEVWKDADFKSPIVESWFEMKKGNKQRSIVLARDFLDKADIKPSYMTASYKLAYPRYWTEEINIAGKKLGIDPYLIIAIIREESYFDENAKSSSSAIGLMQLMPDTANFIGDKLSYNMDTIESLKTPRINLYIGCNYLKYLQERFNDNEIFVIAAYNGGEGLVKKWQKLYPQDDMDEFIESIPFDETRHYVKKIFRTYRLYKMIYG